MNHQEIVSQTSQLAGVTHSFIVNGQGQVTASSAPLSDPEMGAVVSSMYSNIAVQIKRMQRGTLKRLVVETEVGITLLSGLAGAGEIMVIFADVTNDFNLSKLMEAVSRY